MHEIVPAFRVNGTPMCLGIEARKRGNDGWIAVFLLSAGSDPFSAQRRGLQRPPPFLIRWGPSGLVISRTHPDERASGEGPYHVKERLYSRQTYSFMSALAKAANATSVRANTAKLISHGRS